MRKLRLDPERLRVETFLTDESDGRRGTVAAQSFIPTADPFACPGEATPNCAGNTDDVHVYTCGVSCVAMCFETGSRCLN